MNVVCLDFETANHSRASVCAAGLAIFEGCELVENLYWLVKPPRGHGWFIEEWTQNIHGLSWFDFQDAPEFPGIAEPLLERLVAADLVVAHNARFDLSVLATTLEHFHLQAPAFHYLCTYQLARKVWPHLPSHTLDTLAEHIGHDFQHHHAQADAETAGHVLLAMMAHERARTPIDLMHKLELEKCFFEAGSFIQ